MFCTLCQKEFDKDLSASRCSSCLLGGRCHLIRCPYCGFESPEEPDWIRKFIHRFQGRKQILSPLFSNGETRLADFKLRRKAKVTRIATHDRTGLKKLIALGILPDTEVEILEDFPCPVCQIGKSQFALDRELISLIFVKPS